MSAKLKTVHITLTPQIAGLLEAEVTSGRFANLSEAAPGSAGIAAEIRDWRARR